jgi:3-methyladenine DNA glycosylase AlkC
MRFLLKDIYSLAFYNQLVEILEVVLPHFDRVVFLDRIFDTTWDKKELKARMKHTTFVLSQFFPSDFEATSLLMERIIALWQERYATTPSLEFMFLPDYIEKYGINHFEVAVSTMATITPFTSCEFAVRPFILKYGERMIQQMEAWSLHDNHHVRRLASEGARPRLPWAIALPAFKKNPSPILPILEHLKKDSSEYVRRSVANNLNDIAKDNPDVVLTIARKWKGISKQTDGIIKHGCRTLLKQGHPEILAYYSLNKGGHIEVLNFQLITPKIAIGESIMFAFSIRNAQLTPQKVRIEYAIFYLLKNGNHAKKVFKISEKQLNAHETIAVQKKQSFKPITTRTFYTGQHQLALIVNGEERHRQDFELMK